MDNEVVYGNRIYLKPITDADTEMVLRWRNSDATVRFFYYKKPITVEEHTGWLRNKVDNGDVWQYVVYLKDGDVPVGSVYLQHFDLTTLTGESGVFFSEDAPSGQGYATEAVTLIGEKVGFEKLGLLHLTAKVMAHNEASRRVHEKSGYRLMRTIRGESCSDGSTVDSLWFVKDVPAYSFDRKPLLKAHSGKIQVCDAYAGDATDTSRLLVTVPGSKSITNRALLIAMLAEGESVLRGTLFSDDTESLLGCMDSLGIKTDIDRTSCTIRVQGCGGNIPNREAYLNVGSAGTAARFLTAVLGATDGGVYHMDSSDQMKKRPMAPLLDSLKELGCEVVYEGEEGFFPFILKPHGFASDTVCVDIDKSSQFLSALLIASPMSENGLTVNVTGTHGLSYVEMTRKIMEAFGAESSIVITDDSEDPGSAVPKLTSVTPGYFVEHGKYSAADYQVEPDASAAAYFFAMSPLVGKAVTVKGLHNDSMQGDTGFVKMLEQTGWVRTCEEAEGITVMPYDSSSDAELFTGGTECVTNKAELLPELIIDMSSCSDQTITLAAIAPFLERKIRITGISHIRHQESDRISGIVTELKKMGADASEEGDDIVIAPSGLKAADIETYNDHRMAMAFSLPGIKERGIRILNPMCCSKTFPDYFAYLDEIRNLL
jgi:3-phosphoshikimate 1-carboxyvinyltransferase